MCNLASQNAKLGPHSRTWKHCQLYHLRSHGCEAMVPWSTTSFGPRHRHGRKVAAACWCGRAYCRLILATYSQFSFCQTSCTQGPTRTLADLKRDSAEEEQRIRAQSKANQSKRYGGKAAKARPDKYSSFPPNGSQSGAVNQSLSDMSKHMQVIARQFSRIDHIDSQHWKTHWSKQITWTMKRLLTGAIEWGQYKIGTTLDGWIPKLDNHSEMLVELQRHITVNQFDQLSHQNAFLIVFHLYKQLGQEFTGSNQGGDAMAVKWCSSLGAHYSVTNGSLSNSHASDLTPIHWVSARAYSGMADKDDYVNAAIIS